MKSYGIMQGRLTPSKGRGIQFFPFDNWENEFITGEKIGINEIEWIFDFDDYEYNPFWTDKGVKAVKNIIEETNVKIRSVCFDYFMRRPFYKFDADKESVRDENIDFIKHVFNAMSIVGAILLEIPMVDNSSIKTEEEEKASIDFLHEVLEISDDYDILVGCETDMPVGTFRDYLDKVGHDRIRANYDSGNSSGLGYDHQNEILSLGELIANVHIKDRILHGTTVKLGAGSADFDKVFSTLKAIDYKDSIIFQAARGEDGFEIENIQNQMQFVKDYCKKYDLE